MRLTPNLNGTSRKALVEGRMEAVHALRAALDKVRDTWPNGRDFQLAKNPFQELEAECAEWSAAAATIREFADRLEAEAVEIDGAG